MKHRITLFSLLLLTLLRAVPASAQDDGIVTQLQFGRQDITVPADGELVFYDFKGTGSISSTSANNQHSLTVFKPEVAGMSVQITFESLDIRNDGASYPGKVLIYSGDPDPDNAFAWATNTGGVTGSSLMPEGDVLATLDGTYSGLTYFSSAADGAMAVGVLWRYAKASDGWVAKVKCVTLTDMQVTGAASGYEGVLDSPKSKTGVALAHILVSAEGVMNPDHLTGINFSLPVNEGVIDPLSIKIYPEGLTGVKGLTPLEATVTQVGNGYNIAVDNELGSGINRYTLAADILGTAKVGAKVSLQVNAVTTVAHPDGVTPFTAAEPVTITNPAIVCMVSGSQTVYVDETDLSFYDDGGADAQATSKFAGTTTFIPSVAGKKVQIDFTIVEIGTGSIYYQYINVYNGSEAKAENLLATIRNGETFTARSTATDGALTVEFGDNGTTYTGNGFEATVSLFEPQPMTFGGAAMIDYADNTVRAGQQAVPMAIISILTNNTEPALNLENLTLKSEGASGSIASAYLATMTSTPSVVAAATVEGDNISFNLSAPLSLKEGSNQLLLLVDIGSGVVNDQEVKLTLSSLKLSGTSHTPEPTSASRKVFNKIEADAGTQDVTISGNWDVANKPSTYSYYGYDDISGDQVIILRPGQDGSVVQLTFSKLEIRFPSYSYYGSNPVFKVINGAGTSGTVLFEATKTNQTKQIGNAFRSTAADGALTIVFNTNGNRGTSTSNGFTAEAALYKNAPMEIKSVEVIQASTADVYANGIEEEVLRMNIVTEGGESPLSIEELTVDLKGCEQWVKTVKLISTGATESYVQPVTTVASAPAGETVTLRPEEGLGVLAEKNNYLWLAFDMADKLTDGNEIDAQIVSLKIGGKTLTVSDTDPEGVRITRNVYLFHGNDTVIIDEPLIFYDNGGPNAYYTRDHSGSVVFMPSNPANVVRMHFNNFKTGYNDELYLYNGSGTDEANQLLKLYGDKAEPRDLISSTDDGALTARFRTGSYGLTDDGWEIVVDTFTPQPLAMSAVTSESVASARLYGGSQENRILHMQVEVEGERGHLTLNGINFNMQGTTPGAVSTAKVWSTGTEPSFLGAVQFGNDVTPATEATDLSFDGEYKFPHAGTYHFWLTYDVTPGAAIGSKLSGALSTVTLGGETTAPETDVKAEATVMAGMHGDYVIGTSANADYDTFAAAVRDLSNNGVDGPVNMLVEEGVYNEAFTLNHVPGASNVNRVTFRSKDGNRDNVTITYGEEDKSLGQGVINFSDGASFITLQSLTVTSPANNCSGLIMLTGGCYHNTIDNCVVKGHTVATYEERVQLIYTHYLEEADKNCNYFTLSNSRLEGGYYGLSVTGITNLNFPMMIHHVTITGNTFINQSSKALQAMGVIDGLVVRGNRFINDGSAMATDYRNMDLYRCSGKVVVADNVIDIEAGPMSNYDQITNSSYAYGIYIRDISSARASNKLIFNNDIRVSGKEGTSHTLYGINVYDNDPLIQRADIAHNTIVISGAAGSYSAPFFMSAAMTGSSLVNNVLQNLAGGAVVRGTAKGALSGLTITDNALYTNGEIWAMTPSDCNSFESASSTIGQPLGIAEYADFLSEDMRELRTPGNLMAAKPLDFVTTDLLGNKRHESTPTMGAYEYTDQSGIPAWKEGYPAVDGITVNTAILNLSADKASQASYVVVAANADAPTDAEFSSAPSVALHTSKVETATISGLTEATEYKVYVKLVSLADSSVAEIAMVPFTTLVKFAEYPNPEAEITSTDVTEGNEGEEITLTGIGDGGMKPITLTWTDQTGKVIGAGETATVKLTHSMTYRLTVTDARGKEAYDEINVDVLGTQYVATFEDLNIPEESHWGGNNTNAPFYSGSFAFDYYHGVSGGSEFWGHFSYSNSTSTSYATLNDQYNSCVGSGVDGSPTYGVCYADSYTGATYLTVTNNKEGDDVAGMWITNSAWVMDCIENGDGLSSVAGGFDKGDWYKLSITGLLNSSRTGTVEFYLADFRADNEIDRYALDTWQWLDLSALGKVNKLWFTLESTKKNGLSMTTPAYFCVDNVGEACPWQDADNCTVTILDHGDGTLDLNSIFNYDATMGTISYSIESPDNIATLDPANVGIVKIDGTTDEYATEPFMLLAKATRQGRSSYYRIPVTLDYRSNTGGLIDLTADVIKVYPIPARDVLNISTTLDNYSVELIGMSGATVINIDNLSGHAQIPVSSFAPGVYILRVSHDSGTTTRRVIIK
ncbi:MAG: DUF4465 domain-containing protein [Bacteroides sp.]|nr:DUF4465 domain-containing protein [Bacteroides sp.]